MADRELLTRIIEEFVDRPVDSSMNQLMLMRKLWTHCSSNRELDEAMMILVGADLIEVVTAIVVVEVRYKMSPKAREEFNQLFRKRQ